MDKEEILSYYGFPRFGTVSIFQMVRDLGAAGVFPLSYGRGVHLDYVRKERAIRNGYEDVDHLVLVTNLQAVRQSAEVKAKTFCVYSYDWNAADSLLTFHADDYWPYLVRNAWFALRYVDNERASVENLKPNGNTFADLKELTK